MDINRTAIISSYCVSLPVILLYTLLQCLIYVIGEEYIEDDVGSNVAWAAYSFTKPSFIVCPKEKHTLWNSIPTGR